MLVIELRFPGGRYHATPWGRHVNEGVPEWPPSPYRLVRALFDAWRRKRPDWSESEVRGLLAPLASEPPVLYLPPATASHTRSFQHKNTEDPTARALVFDGFVSVNRHDPILVGWHDALLGEQEAGRLQDLVSLLNYLGRSESWVTARVATAAVNQCWNCIPADLGSQTAALELVRVACAVPAATFAQPELSSPTDSRRGAETALPGDPWMRALAFSTGELLRSRRSDPPALRFVQYLRRVDCLDSPPGPRSARPENYAHGVLFALETKVPPTVTVTLEVSERVRRRLMGIHRNLVGDPARVSPRFSGKAPDGRPLEGHRHLYLLPFDRDGDGWLDHMLAVCREPLNTTERAALDRLERVWQPDGRPDIRFVPIRWGTRAALSPPRTTFRSVTPFVPPRHYRRGRGALVDWLADQVRLEAVNHGLVDETSSRGIDVRPLARLERGGRSVRWIEFRRNRKNEPAQLAYGFEIEFPEPVVGPVALGRNSHFGMGLFLPITDA